MKRLRHERGAVHIVWPLELLVHICAQDWALSGAMARTSKTMLRALTTDATLRQCVEVALASGRLYRWLVFALPASLLLMQLAPLQQIQCRGACFVTGGAVAQQLYEREWAGDVDCWCGLDPFDDVAGTEDDVQVDVVRVDGPPHRCLERFDISLTQQGYYDDSGECWSTPLAHYTRASKTIVALPSMQCVEYTVPYGYNGRAMALYYVRKHTLFHDTAVVYHDCAVCEDDPSTGHEPFKPWRARMQKYAARFPGWPVRYTEAYEDKGYLTRKMWESGRLDRS
jgi:hypothetical protein